MHRKLNMIVIAGMLVALAVVSVASGTSAGPLDPTAGPTNTNAYTLDQLWNRLSAGAAGTPSAFTEPSSGPGTGTMHTLDEIMALAPAVDDTNGASAAEVAGGKTFWGLTTGGWGVKTGTAALGSDVSGANGSLTFAIPNGFYTGKTATAQDTALTAGNIREGANIFGVAGSSIQASGTAVEGEVLLGKTFSNASAAGLTGSMPNRGAVILTPGPADVAIVAGYHDGSGKVVGDPDLTAGNIRQGANIFGVAGSSIEASGTAVAGGGSARQDVLQCERGGAHREHAEPRRRDPDAGAGGRRDRGGVSRWFRQSRWGPGPDGGEHPGGGEHLRGGRQLHPGERDCGRGGGSARQDVLQCERGGAHREHAEPRRA